MCIYIYAYHSEGPSQCIVVCLNRHFVVRDAQRYIYIYMYMYIYICIYIYICMYIYIYIHVYVYIYICIHHSKGPSQCIVVFLNRHLVVRDVTHREVPGPLEPVKQPQRALSGLGKSSDKSTR